MTLKAEDRCQTTAEWSQEHTRGQVLRGVVGEVLPRGRGVRPERTHVVYLDEPYCGIAVLTFDPEDLEASDDQRT